MTMMSPVTIPLIERLPHVRGSYEAQAPMKDLTWFRVGGPAEVLFRPVDLDDLMAFRTYVPKDVPVTVIGAGANLLVRDGGIPGVVVRLGRKFSAIAATDSDLAREGLPGIEPFGTCLRVGAGASNVNLAMRTRDMGVAGFAFLRGIPGTVGGALRMNAGAYGSEISQIVLAARTLDSFGNLHWHRLPQLDYSYRHCGLPGDHIFVEAVFRADKGDRDQIAARMAEISAERSTTQPVKSATGGSTFANPDGHKAWELVDRAGCRGLVVGDAQMSEQHCNFMINRGQATAADLEALGETVRLRVLENSGIDLRWEIRRIGVVAEAGA